jgi:uncharacterized Tic20 family protein
LASLPAGLIALERGIGNVALMSTLTLACASPLILIGFFAVFQGVINAIRILNDQPTRYPLRIQFIR